MATQCQFLAFDLGASNGRAILGQLNEGLFHFEEIHRFPTRNVTLLGVNQWDTAAIYQELLTGCHKCVGNGQPRLDSLAIDAWGVDYALLARDGTLLGNPVHYRDRRTEGMPERVFEKIPADELYRLTGIGYNRFNTLFQLLAPLLAQSPQLEIAHAFLMMGDLYHYFLSGQRSCEFTNASTTQLLDPWTGEWQEEIIRRIGLPRRIFKEITPAGTVLGALLPEVAEETGLPRGTQVITPATHDTASVIAAVPVEEDGQPWAYVSCGTWSIMGTELERPLINEESFELEFSNEGGVGGKICFQKTFIGLWLLQECRRLWLRDGLELGYDQMTTEAAEAEPLVSLINVDDPRLYAPDDMPEAIRAICRESGQPVPATRGALLRCALESIAFKSRQTLREMDHVLKRRTTRIHLMGGGVQNRLLCQLMADACGVPVLAGPIEAAILGNLAVQAMALGALGSLAEARRAIRLSSRIQRYEPSGTALWDELEKARIDSGQLSAL